MNNKVVTSIESYVNDVLGVRERVYDCAKAGLISDFLRRKYQFYQINIYYTLCVVMVEKGKKLTAGEVKNDWMEIKKVIQSEVFFVTQRCASYDRTRLIKHKVPFIIPGNQMYLPMLGLDLREYFKSYHTNEDKYLSPLAQVFVIKSVLDKMPALSYSELAEKLGCSVMSISRVSQEIEGFGLGSIESKGRKKKLLLNRPFVPFANPFKRFQAPFKKTLWIDPCSTNLSMLELTKKIVSAGESALAYYTDAIEPKYPVYAVAVKEWKSILALSKMDVLREPEDGCILVELWSYEPGFLSENYYVDKYSLWAGAKGSKDKRIRDAARQLLIDT